MLFKSSLINYCPCCNKPMRKDVLMSRTVKNAASGTEPHGIELTKCPACGAVFFLHHVWAQKEVEIGDEPPDAVYHDRPGIADYRKALEKGLAKNDREEKYLKAKVESGK